MADIANPEQNGIPGSVRPLATPERPPEHMSPQPHSHVGRFERFARKTAQLSGRPVAFFSAVGIVILWLVTGPLFGFSDTWQLVINTGTTIVTFLMVFLIQQSQNRDTLAVQVKLSELIIGVKGAHNKLANAEELSEHELATLHAEYCKMADEALTHLEERRGRAVAREEARNANVQANQQG
jgi:low affinity Fe/Cu permease